MVYGMGFYRSVLRERYRLAILLLVGFVCKLKVEKKLYNILF
jgi:hypothetical protein